MKRNNHILFSLVLLASIFGILFADLAGAFAYTDLSFFLAFICYGIFLFIQKGTSRMSFGIAVFLLLFLGTSYIPTGAGPVTERIGEWFYLFFIAGLLQYTNECWKVQEADQSSSAFRFSKYFRIRYYLLFLYYKIRIVLDCTSGRMQLYLAELIHLLNSIFHKSIEMPDHDRIKTMTTIFGTFTFIADNYEYSILSPAFERPDMELFIKKIRQSIEKGKKVLLLDIGANVGLYTIGLNNRIGKNKFTTYAFEPDPLYHDLLTKNIALNHIRTAVTHNVALGNSHKTVRESGFLLNHSHVQKTVVPFQIRRLDSIVTQSVLSRFDEIFVKIDIEGNEERAMDGGKKVWNSQKPVYLMIEDCVNPNIIQYLIDHGWTFITKITPYDSFWELHTHA